MRKQRKGKWQIWVVDAAAAILAISLTTATAATETTTQDAPAAISQKAESHLTAGATLQLAEIIKEANKAAPQETEWVTVEIETPKPQEKETASDLSEKDKKISLKLSKGDKKIILKITMAEAEGEPIEGKADVILVVMNRVKSEAFPDTVEGVVFQQNQFSTVADGGRYWTTEPDEECEKALEMVLNGWDESRGALYFESCEGTSWHERNLEYLYTVGGHRFYK